LRELLARHPVRATGNLQSLERPVRALSPRRRLRVAHAAMRTSERRVRRVPRIERLSDDGAALLAVDVDVRFGSVMRLA
jgi:hypothetical protein